MACVIARISKRPSTPRYGTATVCPGEATAKAVWPDRHGKRRAAAHPDGFYCHRPADAQFRRRVLPYIDVGARLPDTGDWHVARDSISLAN